jgi:multiple sugar transport system permease protein
MVAPALALLTLFVAVPAALSLVLVGFEWDVLSGAREFVGLENVRDALARGELANSVEVTLRYVVYTVPVSLVAGLAAALAINSVARGGVFWRVVFFLPAASMLAAVAVVWRWLFYPETGLVDAALGSVVGTGWLSSRHLALVAVAVVGNWQGIAFAAIIFLAGLAGVPRTQLEAATLDGAGAWSRFWHVIRPALGPATLFATITTTIGALRAFDQIVVLTDGGPGRSTETLTFMLWRRGIDYLDIGGAAVLNVVLLALALSVTALQLRISRRQVSARSR